MRTDWGLIAFIPVFIWFMGTGMMCTKPVDELTLKDKAEIVFWPIYLTRQVIRDLWS